MKGLVLKDVRVIQSMDHDIKGNSEVVPAAINTNGTVRELSLIHIYPLAGNAKFSAHFLKGMRLPVGKTEPQTQDFFLARRQCP